MVADRSKISFRLLDIRQTFTPETLSGVSYWVSPIVG